MQSALASVPGVDKSQVNFGAREVTVSLEKDVDSKLLIDALKKGGFTAEEKKG